MTATAAHAAPFADARDGLVITPPPGFEARLAESDDNVIGVAIERGKDTSCFAALVKHTETTDPNRLQVTDELMHSFDGVADLGPVARIHGGPAPGSIRSGTPRMPDFHAQVHVAVLAYPAGRILVTCTLPPGESFAPAFEAMVRSIHFAR